MRLSRLLSIATTRRRFLERTLHWCTAVPLALAIDPIPPARGQSGRRPFANRVGWAYTAVPGARIEEMVVDLTRMKQLGCNVVYLGHNNPGDANADKFEPGLSFAVYYALREHTPSEPSAFRMYQAIVLALEAAKRVGLEVVLPI